LVQSVYTLQYGAGLALTTSKYYTPSGRNIQRDYSSFYDYYVADDSEEGGSEVPLKDRKKYTTATGRIVYGGGGITPDIFVKPAPLSRTTQLLEVRSAIFNYGVDYVAKHPDVTQEVTITPQVMEDFVRYASDKDIAPVADIREALTKPNDRSFIERALKSEIIAAKYGFDASYPYRLRGDNQIAKAIEVLPESQKLAEKAAALHVTPGANSSDAGTRAAQALPHGP
jgi:carboxyl-terminal processing protease